MNTYAILCDHNGTTHTGSRAFCRPCGYEGKWREPLSEHIAERDLERHEATAKHRAMLKHRKRPLRKSRS